MNEGLRQACQIVALLLLGLVALSGCGPEPKGSEPTAHTVALGFASPPPEAPPSAFAISSTRSQLAGVVHYRWVLGEVPSEYYTQGVVEWPEPLLLTSPTDALSLLVRTDPEPVSLELRLHNRLDSDGVPRGKPIMSCGLFVKPQTLPPCRYEPPKGGSNYGRLFIEANSLGLTSAHYYITLWILWGVPSPEPGKEPPFRYYSIAYVFSFDL